MRFPSYLLESAVPQFEHQVKELARLKANMGWQSKEHQQYLDSIDVSMKPYKNNLDEACKILAHTMLVNAVLTGAEPGNEKQWPIHASKALGHVQKTLGVKLSALDQAFLVKITPNSS